MLEGQGLTDLTDEEVAHILKLIVDADPLLVGGQAVNLWTVFFGVDVGALMVSRDIDFLDDKQAANLLSAQLDEGRRLMPSVDEATVNTAVVTGRIGGKAVMIDFLSGIIGVDTGELRSNAIGMEIRVGSNLVRVALPHPNHCLASRLGNINQLKRTDERTITQAMASIEVVKRYVDSRIDAEDFKEAQQTLVEVEYIIKDKHVGRTSWSEFGALLRVEDIATGFLDHPGLDERWRNKTLLPSVERTRRRLAKGKQAGPGL